MWVFWYNGGFNLGFYVTCGKIGFLGLGFARFGCIGEILSCVLVITVVTTSSFAK